MKRFFNFILLFIALFTVSSFQEAKGIPTLTDDFSIIGVNTVSSYHIMYYTLLLEDDVDQISFELPDSDYNTNFNGSDRQVIVFWDADSNLIDTFYFEDLYPETEWGVDARTDGYFIFDLNMLGVKGASWISVTMPQTYTSIPAGYLSYHQDFDNDIIQSNTTYDYTFEYEDSTLWRRLVYSSPIIEEAVYFGFELDSRFFPLAVDRVDYFPLGSYQAWWYEDTYDSNVALYEDSSFIESYTWRELFDSGAKEGDRFTILYADIDEVDLVNNFKITIYLKDLATMEDMIEFSDRLIIYDEFENVRLIHYIDRDVEVHSTYRFVGDLLPNANLSLFASIPDDFEFSNWVDSKGEVVGGLPITDEQFPNYNIYVFSRFQVTTGEVDITISDPVVDENNVVLPILADIGWNTPTGYMLFAFTVIVLATIGLHLLKVPTFALVIVDFLLFVLFHYWGFLNPFVVVIGYIIFVVVGIIAFQSLGGKQYE